MYELGDVEWVYGNSLKYITLSSKVVTDFCSGNTYELDILTSQERIDLVKNNARREHLENKITYKEESKK